MATVRGGEKLAAKLAAISKQLSQTAVLRVGFLEGATYPKTATAKLRKKYAKRAAKGKTGALSGVVGGLPVALVAFWNNFGTRRMPPRPFFSNMIANKKGEWPAAIGGLLKANDYNVVKSLDIAGEAIGGQLKRSIIETNSPPLSPVTIRRKGFDKPLIDTSHMINSVGHEVKT